MTMLGFRVEEHDAAAVTLALGEIAEWGPAEDWETDAAG